ncbi:MAG: L-2-hydroxyglutarate oxidase [Gemmatales bacterium]|nr:L-2-hydroxyglutarate oxidase [Gemmatales bacterium]MDW8387006.1 L-2-hydroxyglutarate oxidase [Gemmatales bacterium]
MSASAFEIIVIGGGIVGLATAYALCRRGRKDLVVLEAEAELARHQTGRNSGVIHSGLYYKPGSVKARTCVAGREAMYRFCREQEIPHERCGKVVVATVEEELPALDELERRGQANGLDGLRRLDAKELRDIEPHAAGIAALFVPQTGIVDYRQVATRLSELIERGGGKVVRSAKVLQLQHREMDRIAKTTNGEFVGKRLINCAGLQADRIARLCGIEPDIRIVPFRGEYYELIESKRHLVRNLIYPVPDPRFPFLGVHFTRRISGQVEAGPNAVLALKREGYSKLSCDPRDVFDLLSYRGFWRMSRRYWRTGLAEQWRSWSKRAFVRALQRLVPTVEPSDLVPAGCGVRAQAVGPNGELVDDFRIVHQDGMVHVLNAPSPAATASLVIGEEIADQLD